MKKLFILFLSGLFCVGTVQPQTGDVGPIHWMLNGNELILSGTGDVPDNFFGSTSFISINKEDVESVLIDEGITGIGSFAFVSANITSITLPSSLTTIDVHAFRRCKGLISLSVNTNNPVYYSDDGVLINHASFTLVAYPSGRTGDYTVPDEVKIIGGYAFWECQKLISVHIPQSVITIEEAAFMETGLVSVTINGNTLTTIGGSAFDTCIDLTSINIPASVTQIGDFAFWGCMQLSAITIPASVTIIGYSAFAECNKMIFILVDEDNANYSSADGVLFDKTKTTLICYPSGKSGKYVIPESVNDVESTAFYYCQELTSVTIPASVTSIGNYAFAYCNNLSVIVNLNPEPITILSETFLGIDLSVCTLRVPDVASYETDAGWNGFGNIGPLEVSLDLDMTEVCLLTGATATLIANVTGDVDFPTIVWDSSIQAIATVDNTGKVTALSPGLTVMSASAFGSVAYCTVTVIQPGKSSITGNVNNPGNGAVRVNLYINMADHGTTKRAIIGGYVLLASTVPNGNGAYSFENLPEGYYQIEVVTETYDSDATEALLLSEDEILEAIDFIVEEDKIIYVADIPTGTKELTDVGASIIIYPNPFTDMVRIAGASAETLHATSLQVINAAGAIVHTQFISGTDETIHLGRLSAGVYIIRLESGGEVKTLKIIKN